MYPKNSKKKASQNQSKTLIDFVEINGLKETASLKELRPLDPAKRNVALSLDGSRLLEDARTAVQEQDPLAIFTTSIPPELYYSVFKILGELSEVKTFCEDSGLVFSPQIIFDGCGVRTMQDELTSPPLHFPPEVTQINVNQPPTIDPEFKSKCAERYSIDDDIEGFFVRFFSCKNIEEEYPTMRAPFLAWSQMSAFCSKSNRQVSEVYGSLELLAFPGVDRVILSFEPEAQKFTFVSKKKFFDCMRRHNEDLTDICISAIILFKSTHKSLKLLNTLTVEEFCTSFGRQTDPVAYIVESNEEKKQKYFLRNLAVLDAPVLTNACKVVPLGQLYGQEHNGLNVSEFFGKPLPVVAYFLMMSGPLLTAPFSAVSQDLIVDEWPLVDSRHFRSVSLKVLPLHVQIVYQLILNLNIKYEEGRGTRWLRQYLLKKNTPQENDDRSCSIAEPPMIVLSYWNLGHIDPSRWGEKINFSDVLQFTEKTSDEPYICQNVTSTVIVTLLKSLDLLGYFSHWISPQNQSMSGYSIFSRALDYYVPCPSLSEYGVLLIELYRTGCLTRDQMNLPVTPPLNKVVRETPPFSNQYDPDVLFASRAVSVVHLNINGKWEGPFDSEMAAFGTCTRLVGRALRMLTETIATVLFVNQHTRVPLSEFSSVIKHLPFHYPTDFNAGFLMLYVLSNPYLRLPDLYERFPQATLLDEDLKTLFLFWNMSFSALRTIYREEYMSTPEDANFEVFNVNVLSINRTHQKVMMAFSNLYPGDTLLQGMEQSLIEQDSIDTQYGLKGYNHMM